MSKSRPVNTNTYSNYINRELSLLDFQKRVLEEACDLYHPLIERLKFISIFSSNLDEFFMIRVAGLKSQVAAGVSELSYDGLTPQTQLDKIRETLIPMYQRQADIYNNEIVPELEKNEVFIHRFDDLTKREKSILKRHFLERIFPILTPLNLGPAHPFPRLIERSLNLAFVLEDNHGTTSEQRVAFLQMPKKLPRFLPLSRKSGQHFVLMEQVIKAYADLLFPGMNIKVANTFRVTRDADVEIAEDEAEDLLSEIEEQIKSRRWGRAAVKLEVSGAMPEFLVGLLQEYLDLEDNDIYIMNRPLNMPDFMYFLSLDLPHLKDKPFKSRILPELLTSESIFDAIKKNDLLLHHPFDSFSNSTVRFLNESAKDKNVIAIKTTLYRTGGDSPIITALKKAAENGKQVTAFVELKARFDEKNNIIWARELEHAGVHVVYGILGLKTHCKITIVVRNEGGKLRTYQHLSTGNYNQTTARLYTDTAILTAREEYALDAVHLFNYLTGHSLYHGWKEFVVAPLQLRQRTIELIEREAKLHSDENPGKIIAKFNSLAHRGVIQALYKASQAGVEIILIVRGICCIIPQKEGVSDNIKVISNIGRFLEHTRIFYFKNGGNKEFYMSSADWMTRNLEKRVELMFPVKSTESKELTQEILEAYIKDNTKSWELASDKTYTKKELKKGEQEFSAQEFFLEKYTSYKKAKP
ncbi:MAG: polyphosphate kinase 1 [Candidatus Kapaibacteriales bacterium]